MLFVIHSLILFYFRLRLLRIGVEAFLNSALAALCAVMLFVIHSLILFFFLSTLGAEVVAMLDVLVLFYRRLRLLWI